MKKRSVLAASSLVGIAGAVIAPSAAIAADVTTPCADLVNQDWGTGGDNWYMNCVPQYGLGKVEFTISSDVDYPGGFADLTDASVDVDESFGTTTAAAQAMRYLAKTGSTASTQTYRGAMAFKIASVGAVPVGSLPSACTSGGETYSTAHQVTYLPTTVRYTQTVDGKKWVYSIAVTPAPLTLGMRVDGLARHYCAVSGTEVARGVGHDISDSLKMWEHFTWVADGDGDIVHALSPFVDAERATSDPTDIGTFSRVSVRDDELAKTGVDAANPGGPLAAALGLGGIALIALTRRRRATLGR